MDIEKILTEGIVFRGGKSSAGLHGSGSAKMKAEYRRRRANRHKQG